MGLDAWGLFRVYMHMAEDFGDLSVTFRADMVIMRSQTPTSKSRAFEGGVFFILLFPSTISV